MLASLTPRPVARPHEEPSSAEGGTDAVHAHQRRRAAPCTGRCTGYDTRRCTGRRVGRWPGSLLIQLPPTRTPRSFRSMRPTRAVSVRRKDGAPQAAPAASGPAGIGGAQQEVHQLDQNELDLSQLDPGRLVKVVADFARRATGDFTLEGLLEDLAVAAVQVLAIDGAGVTYRVGEQMRVVHALPDFVAPVERVQEDDQEGPCHDAARTHTPITEGELAEHTERWPRFAAHALAAGVNAVASLPLLARGQVWGAIDLYRRAVGPFDAEQLAAAQMLADVACGYVVMAHDRQQAQDAQEQAAHAATHDVLTGLPNRALLYDRLHHAVATTARNGQGVAVVFLDLDGFKAVNDTHGHHAGDELLRQVATRLAGAVRKGDTLARWGGDEFVVVCESLHRAHPGDSPLKTQVPVSNQAPAQGQDYEPSPQSEPQSDQEETGTVLAGAGEQARIVVDEHALEVIIDRLRACLSDFFTIPTAGAEGRPGRQAQVQAQVQVQVQVAASIGAAAAAPTAGAEQQTVEQLLRTADEAMYRTKRARTLPPQDGASTRTGPTTDKVDNLIVLDSVVHVLVTDDRDHP